MIRPGTGVAPNFWYYGDILKKYTETDKGEQLWRAQWQRSQTQCIHGEKCKRENCEVGKAVQTVNIVSGQFVVLWGFLTECVPRGKRPRLVQVQVQASAAQSATQSVAKNDKESDKGVKMEVETKNDKESDKGVKTEVETKNDKESDRGVKMEVETKNDKESDKGVKMEVETKNDKESDKGVKTEVETKMEVEVKNEAKNDKGVKMEVETKETKNDKEIKTEPKNPTEEPLLITGVRILPGSIARLRSRLAVMQEQQEKAGGCRARV